MLARAKSAAVERLSKGRVPNLAPRCADEDADIKQVTGLVYTYARLEVDISALLLHESCPEGFSKTHREVGHTYGVFRCKFAYCLSVLNQDHYS